MSRDPRIAAIDRRLADIRRIVAVTGGKGGIGKSLVAATLALAAARAGRSVGLLDLDLTGPCAHLILGVDPGFPDEQFGIEPADAHGVRFMSVTSFSGEDPIPLRGSAVSDALIELLAITRWGELDLLVIDMPPGLGDASLDTIRLVDRAGFLVVTTPSRVVTATVRRTLGLLRRMRRPIVGVVENMSGAEGAADELARDHDVELLGRLPRDESVEAAIGDPERLLGTAFGRAVASLVSRCVEAARR